MSRADIIEVVRFALGAPFGSADPHVPAANQCTIIAFEAGGSVQYAQGLLEHGPREGEPPTARYARGTLLFHSNDPLPDQASMGPLTPLETIVVTVHLSEDGVSLELHSEGNAPPMTVSLVRWSAGAMVGTGRWGRLSATYLLDLAPPKALA